MPETHDLYDEPEQEPGEYRFDDPEEYHRHQRLKQIHDSRERFEKGRHRAYHMADEGEISRDRAQAYTAQLALDFIRQLEPLVRRTDSDLLQRAVPVGNGTQATVARLLDSDGIISITTTTTKDDPNTGGERKVTTTEEVTMSRRASTRLVRLGDDFLEDIMPSGIIEEESSEWEI